jgi:hypothetical protein
MAARLSAASILLGAIFVPSDNPVVDEGSVPDRPDMNYRRAHDEATVTFKVLIDGQCRTLTVGSLGAGGIFYDQSGQAVARIVGGHDQRQTLVAAVAVLDRAAAALRRRSGEPDAAPTANDNEPNLCPKPVKEPATANSANSIAYQEYVSKLSCPWAIFLGGVMFDGCDPQTGNLLEAKADIDFMFDDENELQSWLDLKKDPEIQMMRQAIAAKAAGRLVVWHAQTEKGYRGLKNIANGLPFDDLSVIFDPN